jgi:hypothetical protein
MRDQVKIGGIDAMEVSLEKTGAADYRTVLGLSNVCVAGVPAALGAPSCSGARRLRRPC